MGLFRRRGPRTAPVEVRSPLASKAEAEAVGTIAGVLGVGIPGAYAVRTFQRASATGHPTTAAEVVPDDGPKSAGTTRPGVGRPSAAHRPKTD